MEVPGTRGFAEVLKRDVRERKDLKMTMPEDSNAMGVALEAGVEALAESAAVVADSGKRVPELDGLRGVAIALVLLFHCFYFAPGPNYHAKDFIHRLYVWVEGVLAIGWTGVDLFFVLSGFLIGGILLDAKESPRYFRTFYVRRFFRIIPPYYAWIALYIVAMACAGRFLRSQVAGGEVSVEPYTLLTQIAFLQNVGVVNAYPVIAGAWLRSTWSLGVEEQFYLIAPAFIKRLSEIWLKVLLGVTVASAPALRLWFRYHVTRQSGDLDLAYTLMPCRADALGIGILAALLWRDGRFPSWLCRHCRALYAATGIFLAGFVILGKWSPSASSFAMESVGYSWIALTYVLILLLALAKRSGPVAWIARRLWLRELGRVSYCLYLIHSGVILICGALLAAALKHGRSWEGIATNAAAAMISYGIARASWVYFEHPLVKKGHAFKY
jgi:peptidoglycan/LPS O-acetylase OafA/YrhL